MISNKDGWQFEVFGASWADTDQKRAFKNRTILPAGLGPTLASIHYFDGKTSHEAPWPVMIHQTPAHLIVALHFDARYLQRNSGNRVNRFLPFLWRVSKQDPLRKLG